MFNQLDPAYRLQATDGVERAQAELEELRSLLETALIRDREAYSDFFKAIAVRNQVNTKLRMSSLDHFLRDRMEHASERMRASLGDALALAELPVVSNETDPAPFILRRRLANEAMERLKYQIEYLKEWHERLSGVQKSARLHPKPSKNEVPLLRNRLTSEQRAS
jgi:hypothetical protein